MPHGVFVEKRFHRDQRPQPAFLRVAAENEQRSRAESARRYPLRKPGDHPHDPGNSGERDQVQVGLHRIRVGDRIAAFHTAEPQNLPYLRVGFPPNERAGRSIPSSESAGKQPGTAGRIFTEKDHRGRVQDEGAAREQDAREKERNLGGPEHVRDDGRGHYAPCRNVCSWTAGETDNGCQIASRGANRGHIRRGRSDSRIFELLSANDLKHLRIEAETAGDV